MTEFNNMIDKYMSRAVKENPLKIAQSKNLRYYSDFRKTIELLDTCLTQKEMKELLERKLLLTTDYSQFTYLQSASEISVLAYIIEHYKNEFKYEPRYNGRKNPECSFKYKEQIINIEVKTPDLSKRWDAESNSKLKIFLDERIPKREEVVNSVVQSIESNIDNSVYSGVEELKRLDNKLKDFLISANEKFIGTHEEDLNILVVSLDIISDLDEWYSYIFGEDGVFTNKSYVESDKFKNVDAIMLSNAMCGHIRYEVEMNDVWDLGNCGNYLFLNPSKENTRKGEFFREHGLYMFGAYTVDFLEYLISLDIKNSDYMEYRISESMIFTDYFKEKGIIV
ncbi:hypothetical protein [Paenibacillus sp. FSL L8-0506]|uniref:hypothetical protein n=1 Tax=Paenibacillus sp. FSL L8-0506 TaxID=2975335 RepID=UPI0030F7E8FA